MAEVDIIVMGASAGGVEALSTVVSSLPADLPAAVFVVLHVSSNAPSVLPNILTRAGRLPAHHPLDGEVIQSGRIYVAPPDRHLLVRSSTVRLSRGPRENGHRPAVDPLFRSAAVTFGRRVVGVVMSGALDDGTAGLAAIKRLGGIAIVQNPNEAAFPSMPASAIEGVAVDHVLYGREIPEVLGRLVGQRVSGAPVPVPDDIRMEDRIASMEDDALLTGERPGRPAAFSCPDCSGTLYEIEGGRLIRFRCRVGHAFSIETLAARQGDSLEAALWSALVALKEKAAMSERMVKYMRERGHELGASRFEEQAADSHQRAAIIQDVLEQGERAASEPRAEAG